MRTVAILLFDEVEILDAIGPFEVFSVANRMHAQQKTGGAVPFSICTVAGLPIVRARHGLRLLPERLIGECEKCDVLIIPGGVVPRSVNASMTPSTLARLDSKRASEELRVAGRGFAQPPLGRFVQRSQQTDRAVIFELGLPRLGDIENGAYRVVLLQSCAGACAS